MHQNCNHTHQRIYHGSDSACKARMTHLGRLRNIVFGALSHLLEWKTQHRVHIIRRLHPGSRVFQRSFDACPHCPRSIRCSSTTRISVQRSTTQWVRHVVARGRSPLKVCFVRVLLDLPSARQRVQSFLEHDVVHATIQVLLNVSSTAHFLSNSRALEEISIAFRGGCDLHKHLLSLASP